jgi:hypothetical protein
MITRERSLKLKNLDVLFVSDFVDGQILDTYVSFNGESILCIAGEDIEKFSDELKNLIEKYRI